MLTKNIIFKNFDLRYSNLSISKSLKSLLKEKNEVIESTKSSYKDSYTQKQQLTSFKKYSEVILIGMGGSILGSRSIYSFLKDKIKKNLFLMIALNILKLIKKIKKKDQYSYFKIWKYTRNYIKLQCFD